MTRRALVRAAATFGAGGWPSLEPKGMRSRGLQVVSEV
jgi:hypothetical protein